MNTDIVVIGSGFGGSVVAARTAQAGLRVAVLERGSLLNGIQWNSISDGRAGLHLGSYQNGPLDIHAMRGLGALTGNALGGGSRINTAVTIRPPSFIFDSHWPSGLDFAALAACYDRVEAEIRPSACSESLPRIELMTRLGRTLNWAVTRLPLAMDWQRVVQISQDMKSESITGKLASWFRGIEGAKRGLDQTYLRVAKDAGGTIQSDTAVDVIEPVTGGFRVHFHRRDDRGTRPGFLFGRVVVLAAGSLNSVRLLFANRDQHSTLPRISRKLGERFFTNGDRGALLYGVDHDWAADCAPPATSWFDLWNPHRSFIMDLGRSPISNEFLAGYLDVQSDLRVASPARSIRSRAENNFWLLGVMGANESPRRIIHRGNGRIRCTSEPIFAAREDIVLPCIRSMANAAHAAWLMVPAWLERRMPLTVHPLGGAVMADSPDLGVTDSHGEVFGHPGLFIADGSLVPTPTGVPPSMTIAALAERVAMRVVESAR